MTPVPPGSLTVPSSPSQQFPLQRLSFGVQNCHYYTSLAVLEACNGPGTSRPGHVALVLEDIHFIFPQSQEVTDYQFCAPSISVDWCPVQ